MYTSRVFLHNIAIYIYCSLYRTLYCPVYCCTADFSCTGERCDDQSVLPRTLVPSTFASCQPASLQREPGSPVQLKVISESLAPPVIITVFVAAYIQKHGNKRLSYTKTSVSFILMIRSYTTFSALSWEKHSSYYHQCGIMDKANKSSSCPHVKGGRLRQDGEVPKCSQFIG